MNMPETKTLRIGMEFKAYGTVEVTVPAELSLEEAVEYCKVHNEDIPLPPDWEYVSESEDYDAENAKFVEDSQ